MLNGPLTQRIHILTKSSIIYSGSASATMTAVHVIPSGGAYLRIEVGSGTSNSGSITISGTVSATATTETATFTAARWKVTSNKFDAGTVTITSNGLADETVKPTVIIETCDAAGNKVEWSVSKTYPFRMRTVKGFGLSYLAEVKQQGLVAPWIYECFIGGNPVGVAEGQEFTVDKIAGKFLIFGQIQQHQQVDTNIVDYVTFFATKRSD